MKKTLLILSAMLAGFGSFAQSQYAWLQQGVPYTTQAYFFDVEAVNANVVWAVPFYISGTTASPSRDFARTTNGGLTWTIKTMNVTPATLCISNIWPISADTCYVAMYNSSGAGVDRGGVYRTTDGGVTWAKQTSAAFTSTDAFPDVVCFFNSNDGVVIGDPNPASAGYLQIYTTTDGGANWNAVATSNIPQTSGDYGIINLFSHYDNHIWIGTANGDVLHSNDKGNTWTKSSTGLPLQTNTIQDIIFTDSIHGLVQQGDTLMATTDGGATWNMITHTGPLFQADLDAVPGMTRFVSSGSNVGAGFGTSYSDDFGATWNLIDTTNSHTGIDFVDSVTGWTGEVVSPNLTGTDGAWSFLKYNLVPCGDASISPGTTAVNSALICFGDTLVATSTGIVAPTDGNPNAGVSWVISSADISGSTDPLNEPSLVAAYTFNFPAPPTSTRTLINDTTFIGSLVTGIPSGIYYWTPVVFGNATVSNSPPVFLNDLILDPACTYSGTSLPVNIAAPNDPLCNSSGVSEITAIPYGIISVYPQPVNDELTVKYRSKENTTVTISIYDVTGREISSQKTSVNSGMNNVFVDVNTIASGSYILKVVSNNNQFVSKFIRN